MTVGTLIPPLSKALRSTSAMETQPLADFAAPWVAKGCGSFWLGELAGDATARARARRRKF